MTLAEQVHDEPGIDADSIVKAIQTGKLDDDLMRIMYWGRKRSNDLKDQRNYNFWNEVTPLDRVRVINTRPKYLEGCTGTIIRRKSELRIQIRLDNDSVYGLAGTKFEGCGRLTMHSSQLERIEQIMD